MYKPVSNKVDFPAMEEKVLAFWKEDDTFKKSLEKTQGNPEFVFFDGPPFATGLPHYGHLLAGTIKDIIPRYQTMRGRHVERRFGWDTHGLPIEALAQDALKINGAAGIREFGLDKFNEQCRSMVLRYVSEWRQTVTRMGRWVDFDNDYKTMDLPFMETVWWVFKQLWNQGRVYRSHRIVPYSWALNTPLSNSEASANYKDVQDMTVTCRLKVLTGADPAWGTTYLLIWTTTPWTLPENLAVCAGAKIEYSVLHDKADDVNYVMATARVPSVYKKKDAYDVVATLSGEQLKGWTYEPLFPYYESERANGAFRVLNDDYVSTDDGVGLVHMAPAYGEDDFRVCKEAGMTSFVDPLDADCKFNSEIPEYEGRFCKDCDKDIIKRLKAEGKLVYQATITHSYPYCERTDTPLIYRAIDAWYVRVEDLHERFAKNNAPVGWMPEYVGEKRFANWLEGSRDWNISRNRFWGSCIPLWINEEDPDDIICVGSIAELEELSGVKVTDLHKHYVDKILIHKDGKTYRRTPEVLDCWFESGSMPYAQVHYPFENKEDFAKRFPADFIAEGLDQTRGWFYSLMVLSTLLFDKSPYKNVVVNGLVLAEDGKKMSKHLKNYPDPMKVVNAYGADALRLYMINSAVVRAENLRFAESGVKQVLRDLIIPWWNAYSFFVTYANADGWNEAKMVTPDSPNELDRWIVSSLETLISDVTTAMDRYDLQRSVRPFVDFVNNLTNWYIRRSRRRFSKSEDTVDKANAYRTLRYVLVQLSKVAAPFTPFIAEEIYQNLRGSDMPESVHLCDFPTANAAARDLELERRMARIQVVVGLGRQLRTEHDLKVRQPLSKLHAVSSNAEIVADLKQGVDLIRDELNIKEILFGSDESALANISMKANFKVLGPRFGSKMKLAAGAIAKLTAADAAVLASGGTVSISLGDEKADISAGDVAVIRTPKEGLVVAANGAIVVALETALTPELIQEGVAREFVKNVQSLRKEADFKVQQRIVISYAGDEAICDAVKAFHDTIDAETLADACDIAELPDVPVLDLNGHECRIAVRKA